MCATINLERLQSRLFALAEIGYNADTGGMRRFSYTDVDNEAYLFVKKSFEAAGLKVQFDAIGNMYGIKKGNTDRIILLASHIDSVPDGGKYDGPLGVLSALEVVQTIIEQNLTTEHTLVVGVFRDEEGTRFNSGLIGSQYAAQVLPDETYTFADDAGITLKAAIENCSLKDTKYQLPLNLIDTYLELHIEQGKVLEEQNAPVGVVSGIVGIQTQEITITGMAEHAGATPMNMRNDALVGAANCIAAFEKLAHKLGNCVVTVGKITSLPNGSNVIPEKVTFSVDFRSIAPNILTTLQHNIATLTQRICKPRDLKYDIQTFHKAPHILCNENIMAAIKAACEKNDLSTITLTSGAGHDAMNFAGIGIPTGMIFVRSVAGISHNPNEFTTLEDILAGAQVMLDSVLKIDTLSDITQIKN